MSAVLYLQYFLEGGEFMQRQRLLGAIIIILVIVGLVLFLRGDQTQEEKQTTSEGEGVRIEDVVSDLSKQLGVTIPEDVERASLTDVGGGGASGLATRKYEDGTFTHTLLAALPDLQPGKFYQGWLIRGTEGDENYEIISTGQMRQAKGGYLLEFSSADDLRDHARVLVSLESVNDQTPETRVLEGSF